MRAHESVCGFKLNVWCNQRLVSVCLSASVSSNLGHISGSVSVCHETLCVCVCVRDSRFHVVSLQDGLDGQVAHAWVFGEVALGPELVLQHLGKVPDILP